MRGTSLLRVHQKTLFVEGIDDLAAISNLLEQRGYPMTRAARCLEINDSAQGCEDLIARIPVWTKALAGTGPDPAAGFVLDADEDLAARWASVRGRLEPLGLAEPAPTSPPASGFIGYSPGLRVRVGVWLMPDNVTEPGRLEDLLEALVPPSAPLYRWAAEATARAHADLAAPFREVQAKKATLHTWLAWQDPPGQPYGTALKTRALSAGSASADSFVAWLAALFSLTPPTTSTR